MKKISKIEIPLAYALRAYDAYISEKLFPNRWFAPKGTVKISKDRTTLTFKPKGYGKSITLVGKLPRWLPDTMVDSFIREEYKKLKVEGRIVVDIGCNIGDSSAYFLVKGAKKVIGYDIDEQCTKLAKKNLRQFGRGSYLIKTANVQSLKKITKDLHGTRHNSLKIDAEGAEYAIFRNSSDKDILQFDDIIMEYHYGYKPIKERLKALGYKVVYTFPRVRRQKDGNHMFAGILYAHK